MKACKSATEVNRNLAMPIAFCQDIFTTPLQDGGIDST